MVLFVEIGEFYERDLRTVHATFRRNWKLVQQYLSPHPEPVLSQNRQRWPAKKENCKIFSPNTFTFIFSEAFFKGSDGRRKTPYGMLYFSLNPDWKHSTMYGYSHLQTNRFREAVSLPGSAFVDSICLFSLINVPQPPPKYKLFSFPSLIQYICSLPIPDRWGSLHCFWLLDGDLVIADG